MTARQIKKQLEELGWSMSEAARNLGVPSGKGRVSEWCRGIRKVPPYINAHMKTLKDGVTHEGYPSKYWYGMWLKAKKQLKTEIELSSEYINKVGELELELEALKAEVMARFERTVKRGKKAKARR